MKAEVYKYIQEYIAKIQAKGINPTMEQINEALAKFMNEENNRPKESFEGYSPFEMSRILNFTFDIDSSIEFRALTSDEYNQMPLFRQVKHFLQMLMEREIKLTTAGYLPPSIVKELYPLGAGDSLIDSGFLKLSKELNSNSVILTRKITAIAGLTKIRNQKLSITNNGIKTAKDDTKLFKSLFETFCQKFNWAYFDGYPEEQIGQFGFGFSLILLGKYGKVKREDTFYAQKYFKALPKLMEDLMPTYRSVEDYCEGCYSIRTFDRFMLYFSLIEIAKEQKANAPKYITKTDLFDKLIKIYPHREFQPVTK